MEWTIDADASAPPFEQLRQQIAAAVAAGDLAPGERLPTVRALATEMGLAVNTVARAYRELESMGVIRTEGRRGSFVSTPQDDAHADAAAAAADFVRTAQRLGLGRSEAIHLVERHW
ncbi:GntR family transcriptional regulator [uncultured Aeromicrobium sp.]|uniref:GntR family transcriptional regulator n=1 Tax=uncultured Aeromicrobium sp. TaxID=337820 RepID=UPI0025F81BF0|nr:GntR family transcriptional regulator [uncultured Aeromicrobium sp.]